MWLILKLGLCLLVAGNVSAMTTIARVVARRVPVVGALEVLAQRFKADLVIAAEEAFGPRDHLVPPRTLTPQEEEFEVILMQRRLEHGLGPVATKR